eukprot:scaffold226180_cov15-Tisochrysis_lutea.AAC.1
MLSFPNTPQVLNAKPENVERESEIVAQSGRKGAVTISTNMAGRGALLSCKISANHTLVTWLHLYQCWWNSSCTGLPVRLSSCKSISLKCVCVCAFMHMGWTKGA